MACQGHGGSITVDGVIEFVHREGGLGVCCNGHCDHQQEQGSPQCPFRKGVERYHILIFCLNHSAKIKNNGVRKKKSKIFLMRNGE